jgi:hypothetical protein
MGTRPVLVPLLKGCTTDDEHKNVPRKSVELGVFLENDVEMDRLLRPLPASLLRESGVWHLAYSRKIGVRTRAIAKSRF